MSFSFPIKLEFTNFEPCKFSPNHPYHNGLINLYKSFPQHLRDYQPQNRRWTFCLSSYELFLEKVKNEFPLYEVQELPKNLIKFFRKKGTEEPSLCATPTNPNEEFEALGCLSSKLQEGLFPYQKEGFLFGVKKNGRALLGDDMGLGKTIQGLAIADYYRSKWPLLVICPSSVRFNWKAEALQWLDDVEEEDITVAVKASVPLETMICIVSYDLVNGLKKKGNLGSGQFDVIICDESHYLKNPDAKRTKEVTPLVNTASHAILLSGTPALSRPVELYPQLHMLRRDLFPQYYQFAERYCEGRKGPFGYEAKGASNLDELNLLLKSMIMIRRLKSDYPDSLPPKDREWIEVPASPAVLAEIEQGKQELDSLQAQIEQTSDEETTAVLDVLRKNVLSKLYRLSGHAKIGSAIEHIKQMLGRKQRHLLKKKHEDTKDDDQEVARRKVNMDLKEISKQDQGENSSKRRSKRKRAVISSSKDFFNTFKEDQETDSASSQDSPALKTDKAFAGSSQDNICRDGGNQSADNCEDRVEEFSPTSVNNGQKTYSKIVVFCHNMTVMDAIEDALKSDEVQYIRIDGKTHAKKRHVLIEAFQKDPPVSVALLSMTACGQGITLHAANLAIFAELHWTPGCLRQCEDRVHRVGQTSEVRIQYLVNKKTMDHGILSIIQKKEGVLSSAIGQNAETSNKIVDGGRLPKREKLDKKKTEPSSGAQQTMHNFIVQRAPTPREVCQGRTQTVVNIPHPSNHIFPTVNEPSQLSVGHSQPAGSLSIEVQERIRKNKEAALLKRQQKDTSLTSGSSAQNFTTMNSKSFYGNPRNVGSCQVQKGTAFGLHRQNPLLNSSCTRKDCSQIQKLSPTQLQRIEINRQRALAKRQQALSTQMK